jgi:hypothetical protein
VLGCRYPFLLVDRVVEIEYGKYAVGYKNVTVNDEFFNGHFPERAIMPGETPCNCPHPPLPPAHPLLAAAVGPLRRHDANSFDRN